jgi:YebC/PmpR family DNA-binding regulatory protein
VSGHSKWANIKHKKAREDAKRGQAFTKLTKEITVTAREGGGNPSHNNRLRLLVDKARKINMPLDNITRAIKRGTGELPGVTYEAFTYEGYGPNGSAVIVETLTDNKNRIAAEMRHLFSSHGGSLAETGAVNWMFERAGVVRIEQSSMSEDELLEKLLEHDVMDIKKDEDGISILCDPRALESIRTALEGMGLKVESAQLEWVPKTPMQLSQEQADKAYEFLSELDDHDDVQNVYTNLA